MPPHKLDVFAGVQFWYNKFGYPSRGTNPGASPLKNDGGATELTPYIGMGIHF